MVITSLALTCNATRDLQQWTIITSWLFSRNFNLKKFFSYGERFFEDQILIPGIRTVPQDITSRATSQFPG